MDRRKFVGSAAAGAAVMGLGAVGRAGNAHELVLSDVMALVDGKFARRDVGVDNGVISAIAEPGTLSGARTTRGGGELYASPGWVDLHVHYVSWREGKTAGSPIKRLGTKLGVTGMVDAGTTGVDNFNRLVKAAEGSDEVPCYAFIYIARGGIKLTDFYMTRTGWDDIPAMEKVIEQNRDRIVGIKFRADHQVTPRKDRLYYLRKCREAGDRFGLPLMIHIGSPPPALPEVLPYLKEGDFITHCFRPIENSVVGEDLKLLDAVKEAKARGVRFDVGHGMGSFQFEAAESALDQGFDDFTISSDLYILTTRLYARTFANVLTQFLTLGVPLEDIMYKASSKPAQFLGLEREIKVGSEATMTVFKVETGDFVCEDVKRQKRKTDKRIFPEYTVMKGEVVNAGLFDRKIFG